jgi:hypothetical protein
VVEGFAGTLQVPVLAEILMEKARLLSIPGDTGCANFLLTVEAAGEEIGKFLELTPVIRARLQQENPMSPEEYINLLNRYWEQQRE